MRYRWLSLLAVCVLPVTSLAQSAPTPDFVALEKALEAKRLDLHVPGAAIVVVKDDRVVYSKGLGYRDLEGSLPVTPDTLFAIGSSTKAFTAMTVMMSVDDGKLKTSDPPKKYLPYFSLRDPDANTKITVSDLMCHKSGLARTDLAWYTGKLTRREIIQTAGQCKPAAKYGERFQYQNVMFLAAGEVVAQAQHRPWEEVLKRRIFDPLKMKASTLSIERLAESPDHALGYQITGEHNEARVMPYHDLRCIAPAGAINSNSHDMAQWLRFMLNQGVVNGKRLVSEASYKEILSPHMVVTPGMQYGYGWFLSERQGHTMIDHGGNIDGFTAEVAFMPDQRLGVVVLSNQNASAFPTVARNLILDSYLPSPASAAPAPVAAVTAGPAVRPEEEAGVYSYEDKLNITLKFENGKLTATVPGQPVYPLLSVGGRKYKLAAPAPDGFFVTFRPGKKDPAVTEMFLQQPQGNLVLTRKVIAPYVAPLTVDALQQKVIDALGGEAALQKHTSRTIKATVQVDTQGLTGTATLYAKAPRMVAEWTQFYALKKRILTQHAWCNGKYAEEATSLTPTVVQKGKGLVDQTTAADFNEPLHWKTLYKTVVIKRQEAVNGEDCYVVEKTPEGGDPCTDYISTRTFLTLKRELLNRNDTTGAEQPVTDVFSDYRAVDGVQVPFKRLRSAPGGDEEQMTVQSVEWNRRISDHLFR